MVLSTAQREARATRIGASEVAAIMGEHPYMTPLDVYDRIVNGVQREQSINMAVGAYLEPYVLRMARDLLGIRSRACHRAYIHPTLPLCASPDAYSGPHGLVEVKVSGAWSKGRPGAFWQVQTQMMLTGRDWCDIVALAGSNLTVERVDADVSAWARIISEVNRFNDEHLTPRVPPVLPPFTFKE
jgi:predicted phage-related endonuclease